MPRCAHLPIDLFDPPPRDNLTIALSLAIATGGRHWVICRRCGVADYWGGYGLKRKIRWGRGGDYILQQAMEHDHWLRREAWKQ